MTRRILFLVFSFCAVLCLKMSSLGAQSAITDLKQLNDRNAWTGSQDINSNQGSDGPIDSQGGPDGYGYHWVDNQGGDTAVYVWQELRFDPQALHLPASSFTGGADDGITSPISIGFNFPFYGYHLQQVSICTNGNLQFNTSNATFSNACLPANSHGTAIFPFWDDLHLARNGSPIGDNKVHFKYTPSVFVVEWDSVGYYSGAGAVSMQVFLYNNGWIKVQYKDLTGLTNSATVGIQQSGTGTQLQYTCNATGFLASGRAVWYSRCDVQPPPDHFLEGEPICYDGYEDYYNSGCNTPNQIFQPIDCGQTVFATSGTYLGGDGFNRRDTDWFQYFVNQPTQINWQVTAEFDVQLLVIRPGPNYCLDYQIVGATTSPACQPAQISVGCAEPGPVWLWAGPVTFTGVPCGSEYIGTFSCNPCQPPPPNDNCAGAIPLAGEITVTFTNISATTDGPDEPALCMSGGDTQVGSDIWYSYIPDCDGTLTVSLCGSNYDTKLAIYQPADGTCPTQPSAVACNDDLCGLSSQITLPVIGGSYYLFRVGGWNAAQGSGTLTVSRDQPCPPPIPCVSVGYIQISPSDGLLDHYGRINTCRVELSNLEPNAVTVPLTISDCEQSINYEVTLQPFECRLTTLPFAWTPNIECQPNFISVSVPWEPVCGGDPMYTKPLPVARTPYQSFSMNDGVASGNGFVPPPTGEIVLTAVEIQDDVCNIEYVRYLMDSDTPDTLRDPIDLMIYDDSGPGGTPGNILAYISSATTRRLEDYQIYGVPMQQITVSGGRLYCGFRNPAHCAPAGLEGIAVDALYDHPGTTYLQSGANWIPVNPPGDMMIDVYTRCPCATQGSSPSLGYNYVTSDDPLGPEFNWVDISTVGTAWSDSCPSCNPVDTPDPTMFGGDWVNTLKISLNGFISYQFSGLGSGHMAMPDTALPNAVVAPLWTECETCVNFTGEVYYYADPSNSNIIVQWDSVLARGTDRLWFEAILYSNGDILYQYRNTPTFLDYTIGLESADGTDALVVYQEGGCPPIHDNFAVLFTHTTAPPGVERLTVRRDQGLSSNVILRWESVGPDLHYSVFADNTSNFNPPGQGTFLGTTQATNFTDMGAVNGNVKRFYRVIAGNMPPQGGNDNAKH